MISAVSHTPRLLILDEPTNGLDPEMVMLFEAFVKEYVSRGNIVLLSTHHLEFAAKFCDKVILIQKVKSSPKGRPKNYKLKPAVRHLKKRLLIFLTSMINWNSLKIFSHFPISNSVAQNSCGNFKIPARYFNLADNRGVVIHLFSHANSQMAV